MTVQGANRGSVTAAIEDSIGKLVRMRGRNDGRLGDAEQREHLEARLAIVGEHAPVGGGGHHRLALLDAPQLHAHVLGLDGDHHFYVSFATSAPGVVIPPALASRYPDEMTVVIQHRFWELEVEPEAFSVTLTFDGVPQRLSVPFEAVLTFHDPAAQLLLRFEEATPEASEVEEPDEALQDGEASSAERASGSVVRLDDFRKR